MTGKAREPKIYQLDWDIVAMKAGTFPWSQTLLEDRPLVKIGEGICMIICILWAEVSKLNLLANPQTRRTHKDSAILRWTFKMRACDKIPGFVDSAFYVVFRQRKGMLKT